MRALYPNMFRENQFTVNSISQISDGNTDSSTIENEKKKDAST